MAADLQKAQQIYDSMSAEQRKQFEQQYWGEQKAQDFLQSQQDRTPTQPQSTTRTQSTPTPKQEIQPQKAPTATTQQWRPELLPESDYKDDSDQRQRGIVANLNEAVYLNPQSLSDYNTFANYYNYEGRSDLQKQTLDNRYSWYQKSQEYSTKSVKELQSLYNANVISQSDLSLLKVYDPNKYNELNSLISKTADLKTYADQLSGTEITTPTNPFQWIIDNFVQWLQSFSQTNFYDEYRDTINSPALKQKNQEIIAEQAEMERLDLLINNKRKDVEERYAGTGATKSKIAAIIADETYELQLEKANRAITLNAMVNSYNSELGNAREELNIKLQEYNMGLQQRQQQMQELWFAMSLMNFETNAQRDEREWNNFIRQQEYQNWDIFSNDPKVRNKAIEKAVDTVLQEFSGIPMIRSREQMVEDITVLVNGGMSLWEAITKNIRDPIMNKPEYKRIMNEKFGVKYDQNVVNIGWKDYIQTTDANGEISFKPFVDQWLSEKINDYTYNKIDLWDGRVIGTGQTVNLAWQDYRITQLWGSMTGWVDLAFPKAWTKWQIWAFEWGTVLRQGTDKAIDWYKPNKYIEILNDNGYVYRYNHLEEIGDWYQSFAIGKRINQWDIIGRMWSTGKSTWVHLDLWVYSWDRANSMSVSPLDIVEQTKILFGSWWQPVETSWTLIERVNILKSSMSKQARDSFDEALKNAEWNQTLIENIVKDMEIDKYYDRIKDPLNDYQKAEAPLREINDAFSRIDAVWQSYKENPKSVTSKNTLDQVLVIWLNKILDPWSVVRESEFARAPEWMSFFNKWEWKIGKLSEWWVWLTDSERNEIVNAVTLMKKWQQWAINTYKNELLLAWKTLNVPESFIYGMIWWESKFITDNIQPQIDPSIYFWNLINTIMTWGLLEQYNIDLSNYNQQW